MAFKKENYQLKVLQEKTQKHFTESPAPRSRMIFEKKYTHLRMTLRLRNSEVSCVNGVVSSISFLINIDRAKALEEEDKAFHF